MSDISSNYIEPGKKWGYCGFCKNKKIFMENPITKKWRCMECGIKKASIEQTVFFLPE